MRCSYTDRSLFTIKDMKFKIYLLLPVFLPLIGLSQTLTFSGPAYPWPGDENTGSTIHLPECTPPKNVNTEVVDGEIHLSWEGPLPAANAIRYEIGYSGVQGTNILSNNTILVSNGSNSITLRDLDTALQYNIRIRKLCDNQDAAFGNASTWVETGPVGLNVTVSESSFCGGFYVPTGCPGTPAPENATFTQLTIRGFLIDVITMYRTGEWPSYWTGTGLMHLPFQEKKVKVTFTARSITTEGVICDGMAEGMSDLPAYWPNFYPPASPTNEICLPAGTHVGFDPNTCLLYTSPSPRD